MPIYIISVLLYLYYEDLRDEVNEEIADIDKEIGKLTPKAELVD